VITIVIFQAWNLYSYLKEYRDCLLKEENRIEFSKWPTSSKIILQWMIGNVVMPEVDALM
jgi:hypothetical protein